MGRVDAAIDPLIGRQVALKSLRREFLEDERAIASFIEEARVTGQLEHPNVVPIYDLGESADDPFIVMRLVRGRSLTQLIAESEAPATSTAANELLRRLVQIILRLCDALSFAHGRRVFHCDVKPDNVMVGEHGEVYLMDWGIASTAHPRDSIAGTVGYMAPEQLLGHHQDIDARTDVFGLGGLLYEILTGRAPNAGRRMVDVAFASSTRTFSPGRLWKQLPPELCRIANRALTPEREERHPTVAAFAADLEQFLKGGGWFDTLACTDGTTIVTEGEPGHTAYIIQEGRCEVWKSLHGEPRLIRELGPGDVFGETAVFTGGLRTASVVAKGDVTLKVVTGDALNQELDQNPTLAAFVRSLAELFKDVDRKLSLRPGPFEP